MSDDDFNKGAHSGYFGGGMPSSSSERAGYLAGQERKRQEEQAKKREAEHYKKMFSSSTQSGQVATPHQDTTPYLQDLYDSMPEWMQKLSYILAGIGFLGGLGFGLYDVGFHWLVILYALGLGLAGFLIPMFSMIALGLAIIAGVGYALLFLLSML